MRWTGHRSIFSFFKGGPIVTWFPKENRYFLIGIVHGAFFDCSNILPGIFVQVDEISVLNFLRKEIFGDNTTQITTLPQSSKTTTVITNCPDDSDEERCNHQCPGYTVPIKFVCDGFPNCPDNSDEENCPGNLLFLIALWQLCAAMIKFSAPVMYFN